MFVCYKSRCACPIMSEDNKDSKRRLSSDGSTPKPDSKLAKTGRGANGGQVGTFKNTPPPAHSNTAQPAWVDQLMIRIGELDAKMSKIDKVSSDLTILCDRIENIQTRVGNLEKFTGNLGNSMGEIKKSQTSLKGDVEETVKEIRELKLANKQLDGQITDMQARRMRDNLLFFGLAEYRGSGNENCVNLINEFREAELNIVGIKDNIERAHRIGRFQYNKTRPIVVKFSNFRVRESVRTSGYKLKNKQYNIREQFPKEIVEKRKALMPILRKALEENRRAVLKYDKLFIDGKLYMGETGNTINTEAGRDDPEDDEPADILTEDAGNGRGEA